MTAIRPLRRTRRTAMVLLVVAVAQPMTACGGGSAGSGDAEVEAAISGFFSSPDVTFGVGLNPSGAIVGVHDSVAHYFTSDASVFAPTAKKRFENVEVSNVAVGDDVDADVQSGAPEGTVAASADIRFDMTGGGVPSGQSITCEGAVVLFEQDGAWKPTIFTVGSCS